MTLAQGEDVLVGVFGRVFLLALGVWAGLPPGFFVSKALVIPFMVLKTIVDVWGFRVEGAEEAGGDGVRVEGPERWQSHRSGKRALPELTRAQ